MSRTSLPHSLDRRRTQSRVTPEDRLIGANLRRLRLARGVTQGEIATLLAVSYQQVQKYESGTNRIGMARLLILRDFYAVCLEDFMAGLPGTAARAPEAQTIDDPDVLAVCRRLANIPDRALRHKARRILDMLISQG